MIFSYLWIKKYKVLINILNNFIKFFSKYYTYLEVLLFSIFTMLIKKTEIILIVINQDIFFNQIFKKDLIKKIDNFLKTLEKVLKKRK